MMSDKRIKNMMEAVVQNDVYIKTIAEVSDVERQNVEQTLEGFATLLEPLMRAVEELEHSEELVDEVRRRLTEKKRDA